MGKDDRRRRWWGRAAPRSATAAARERRDAAMGRVLAGVLEGSGRSGAGGWGRKGMADGLGFDADVVVVLWCAECLFVLMYFFGIKNKRISSLHQRLF